MKDYYEPSHRKKSSYLYYGLITAALACFSVVWGILSAVRGESLSIVITCFIGAVFWAAAALLSLYVFYDANRSSIASDPNNQ